MQDFLDKNRTFRRVYRLQNQLVGLCSLTTEPTEGKEPENISRKSLRRTESIITLHERPSRNENSNAAISNSDSTRKRKYVTMNRQIFSNSAQ